VSGHHKPKISTIIPYTNVETCSAASRDRPHVKNAPKLTQVM
jgi:hypothetical protein